MSMWRSQDCILGDANCTKPDTSGTFIGNPPFDDLRFIGGWHCERKHYHNKAKHKFINDDKADIRRKMGLNK